MSRASLFAAVLLFTACAAISRPATADPASFPTIGGREGEIDFDSSIVAALGTAQPSARESTWQPADTNFVSIGAGYAVGSLGPLHDCYARVDGGIFQSASERVESATDVLPRGFVFHNRDRGGLVRALVSANLLEGSRYAFGLFIQAALPLQLNLAKFSTLHVNLVGAGSTLDVALTEPKELLHLRYRARFVIGSGAYDGARQSNAQLQLTNLVRLESARWLLPWPVGLAVGPHIEADLNAYRNEPYAVAYGAAAPDAAVGERIQTTSVAVAVMPYVKLTEHVSLEATYQRVIVGSQVPATQTWAASLRTAF